jgi:hypothetical protein
MATFQTVINDLDSYERNWARRSDEIPREIYVNILAQIVATDSIDTGRFYRALDFREEAYGQGYRYLIDSSRDEEVTYEGFLEFGTKRVNAFGVLISPRHNFREGIKNSNLERIFDSIADDSFAR